MSKKSLGSSATLWVLKRLDEIQRQTGKRVPDDNDLEMAFYAGYALAPDETKEMISDLKKSFHLS